MKMNFAKKATALAMSVLFDVSLQDGVSNSSVKKVEVIICRGSVDLED